MNCALYSTDIHMNYTINIHNVRKKNTLNVFRGVGPVQTYREMNYFEMLEIIV